MATGTIKQTMNLITVMATGSGEVTSAGGYANIDLTFTPPANSTFMCEVVDNVGATVSTNGINTLVRISRDSTSSRYRCVSSAAQTVQVRAIRLYRIP